MRTGAYTCIAIPSSPPTLFARAGTALQRLCAHAAAAAAATHSIPPSFPVHFASQPCVRLTREARGNAPPPSRHAQRQVLNTPTLQHRKPLTKNTIQCLPALLPNRYSPTINLLHSEPCSNACLAPCSGCAAAARGFRRTAREFDRCDDDAYVWHGHQACCWGCLRRLQCERCDCFRFCAVLQHLIAPQNYFCHDKDGEFSSEKIKELPSAVQAMGDPNQMMNQQVKQQLPRFLKPQSGNIISENDDDGHGAPDAHDGHHHLLLQVRITKMHLLARHFSRVSRSIAAGLSLRRLPSPLHSASRP
jgi:hypothetical protein